MNFNILPVIYNSRSNFIDKDGFRSRFLKKGPNNGQSTTAILKRDIHKS